MNVLVLSQYFWPESFRINEVAESLRHAGCEVTVLTGSPNYPDGKVFAGYSAWRGGREEGPGGVPVFRVPIFPRGSGSAWRLSLNYLSFVVSGSLLGPWLLRGRSFDVIFVYGISPILQAIPGMVLRRRTGAALVMWVQDLWPQALDATGYVKNAGLLRAVGSLVRWIYRKCDLLLVQSHAFETSVKSMAGATPVLYHPNPGERAFDDETLRQESEVVLGSGFNVVFAGNLGTVQALDTLLDAAELLLPEPDVRIVIVGSGSRGEWLFQEATRRRLHNVRFIGRVAPETMPSVLAQASALVVSLVRDPLLGQTVPSKIQAYLAAGRPVIASLEGEGARVVEEAGAGISCRAEDAGALAQAIRRLRAATPAELQRMGEAGRCYYRAHFDPAALAQRLKEHFQAALRRT
jgi:glycosyltransferase involved in cell wall biosynthesis